MKNKITKFGGVKTSKGITLIALIITIIVMLILVGVTLSIALDNNGIISKTQSAKADQEEAAIKEQLHAFITAEAIEDQTISSTGTPLGTITVNGKTYTVTATEGTEDVVITIESEGFSKSYTLTGDLKITGVNFVPSTPSVDWEWADNKIKIYTAQGLKNLRNFVNGEGAFVDSSITANSLSEITVELQNNINLGGEAWTPIGIANSNTVKLFMGTFDGNNKTISNFVVNDASTGVGSENIITSCYGLFGCVSNGTISNLTVSDATITTTALNTRLSIMLGGIVGMADEESSITNCHFSGVISGAVLDNDIPAGGIVGYYSSTNDISNCSFNGTIEATSVCGGIASNATNAKIINCSSTGTGIVSLGGRAGGIVGKGQRVENCINTSSVTGRTSGGIMAYSNEGITINSCCNKANIYGTSAGGIIGVLENSQSYTISDCYNMGTISNTAESTGNNICIGGILGGMWDAASASVNISNSYNTGNISEVDLTGTGTIYKGAIAGSLVSNTNIVNCYYGADSITNTHGKMYSGTQIATSNLFEISAQVSTATGELNASRLETYWIVKEGTRFPVLEWEE